MTEDIGQFKFLQYRKEEVKTREKKIDIKRILNFYLSSTCTQSPCRRKGERMDLLLISIVVETFPKLRFSVP